MPYKITTNDKGEYCVYTQGADGEPTGDPHGCHPTEDAAKEQMKALYANVEDAKETKSVIEIVSSKADYAGIEYKSIGGLEPQSINGRTVDGIAAVMGNRDDAGDITHNGAFQKTIQEQNGRVMFTFNHEIMDTPRAKIDDLKEIARNDLPFQIKARYPQATGGLFVRRTYLETPRGEEAFAGVKSGAIPEMSYGYQAIKKDFGTYEGKSIRNLREVRLIDVCDTTLGVNPATMAKKSALEFKVLEIVGSVKAARALLATGVDFKAGRRNSAGDEAKIQSVIDALEKQLEVLEELVGLAEPPAEEAAEEKALTDHGILLGLLELKLADFQV